MNTQTSWGALVGVIIIVLLLIAAGLYFFFGLHPSTS